MVLARTLHRVHFLLPLLLGALPASPLEIPAQPRGKATPFLHLGAPENSTGMSSDTPGPQYRLFACQLGLAVAKCYDPYQMRRAYGIDALIDQGYDGEGHTIVIVDAFQSPNIAQELEGFDEFYGLPCLDGLGAPTSSCRGTFTEVAPYGLTPFVPGDPDMTSWAEEISLDVEWAHAIAPGANITLVLAKSDADADLLAAVEYAVDNNLGDVISMSFGENESCVDPDILSAYHEAFAEATREGITIFASSGDWGAAQLTCDGSSWERAVSHPASDPLVTAVGGTELDAADYCLSARGCDPLTHPEPGAYLHEKAWNEGDPFGDFTQVFPYTIATGGGFSVLFHRPPYQGGLVDEAALEHTLHGGKTRAVPDVAYSAAVLHGALVYLDIPGVTPAFYLFGGTSAGSPQWAAITAIADQKASARLGFLNPTIYRISRMDRAYAASFHDITEGTSSAAEPDANNQEVIVPGFQSHGGWDATTGNGSPRAPVLVDRLIRYISRDDDDAAIATTPEPHPSPVVPGHMAPH